MAITFSLSDESKKRLHPEALRCFNDCMADIEEDLPEALKNLNEDDLIFLSTDDDKHPLQTHFNKMMEVLSKYVDIEEGAAVYPEVKSALALPIANIKYLLSDAYLQKLRGDQCHRLEEGVGCIAKILGFKHENVSRIHLHALERLNELNNDILREVPEFGQLDINEINADLDTYLNDGDKARLEEDKVDITEWLCKSVDVTDSSSYPYATWIIHPMSEFKSLIQKAYRAKAEEAREEERRQQEEAEAERMKKEKEERWWAAYKALNIPATDASTYLKPEEHEEFADSILGAVDAYFAKKESYILDSRAGDYLLWINEINKRKEEERQKIVDNLAAREFNNSLSKHIAGLKYKLSNKPRDLQNYFTAKIQDKRYTGHNFDYVLDDEQERRFDVTLVRVANDKLKQIIPPDLLEFIEIPSTYYRLYFPLPLISFNFEGIPCLDFCFDIFTTAYAEVLLKPKVKKFGICSFNLPAGKEGSVLVPLEEPELLGYFYILLTPEDLGGYVPWETIPLVLLKGLMNGETKPPGITISAASDSTVTYKIAKFKEEVNIPDSFASYLRDIGNFDKLLSKANATEKVASIVRAELRELKVEHEALSPEGKTIRKDSKKEKAFRLFREGKGPTSPEIKALRLHKSTPFKYYNQYLSH